MKLPYLAMRILLRDFRAGELSVLGAAVVIAVSAVTAVGFFADRIEQAVKLEANVLIGGDLSLVSDHPPAADIAAEARARGIAVARTTSFLSQVILGSRNQLAEIKAVDKAYPLRGELRIAAHPHAADMPATGVPAPGEAWFEARLLGQLGATVGDNIELGAARLRIKAIITHEPDRSGNLFRFAPRVMVNQADLEATRLIQPGSRVVFRLLFAAQAERVAGFRAWAQSRLKRGEKLEGVEDARPEIRSLFERSRRFLGLAALVTVVLAAAAVALGARCFMQRHLDGCAVMRQLGASQRTLFQLYCCEFIGLGLISGIIGCAIGLLVQQLLMAMLAGLVPHDMPRITPLPAVKGMLIGLVLITVFSVPYLWRLKGVAPLRILRREMGLPRGGDLMVALFGAGVLTGLLMAQAGEPKLGLYVVIGLVAALGAVTASVLASIVMLRCVAAVLPAPARRGIGRFARRPAASIVQVGAFALGIMALLLLTAVRDGLFKSWETSLPRDASNRFIINIQPDQLQDMHEFFARRAMTAPKIFPMVKGRLLTIGDVPVSAADYPDNERAQRLVEREFNLSWAAAPPAENRITAGRWWQPDESGALLSVEQGVAGDLGLGVGDRLTFDVAGQSVSATIANIRAVDWD
ncbi:MAG: ABC transporter permease, partial [Burkholderiales bacterium]